MKKVLIKVKGSQGLGEEKEVIELTTEGSIDVTENTVTLRYSEGELLGEKRVDTTLTAKGSDSVVLERRGDLSSRLIIEKGVRTSCFYSTPIGDLTLGIYGKEIKNRLLESGELKMTYTLDTNMQAISENTVEISVREVE